MALRDLLNTFKAEPKKESVCAEIERYLITKREGKDISRPYEFREKSVHHPSSLSSINCMRHLVYGWLQTPKSNIQDSAKSQRIFDTGHDFGYRIQAYLWDMGILLGEWLCVACGSRWLDVDNPSPRKCASCGAVFHLGFNLHYLEVPIADKERRIVGKSDGMLLRPWGRQMIEIKTIKNRDSRAGVKSACFEDLMEPRIAHTHQLMLYTDIAARQYGRKHRDDLVSGCVVYGAKNNQELKEFSVTVVPEIVNKMYVKAELIDNYVNQGVLPDRIEESSSGYECRYCPYLNFCWSEHTFGDADKRKLGG